VQNSGPNTGPNLPSFADAPPLHSDADILARVRALVGPACVDHQLWILLIDGDDRQLPTVLPISGMPPSPDRRLMRGLERLLNGLRDSLRTPAGPGSVIFAVERTGPDVVRPLDREWSNALRVACAHAGIGLSGVFLSTAGGVRRLDGPT
jgi:hypothetical protein